MNLGKLRQEITDLVDDDSYEESLTDLINTVYVQAVNEPGVWIPSLKGMGSVTTVEGDNSTNLVGDPYFMGRLLRFGDPTKVVIYDSLESLLDEYQEDGAFKNEEGDVEAVALEGNVLWYQKVPATASTYGVLYYKNPTALVLTTDTPVAIPEAFQLEILVYGVAQFLFDKAEDGIEGPKVNTLNCERVYKRGINRLLSFLGARRTPNKRSVWDV